MSTTTTPPATRKCNRCGGKGNLQCRAAHLGMPGLCYDCNGAGVVPQDFYKDRRAAQVAAKADAAERDAFYAAMDARLDARHEARSEALLAAGWREVRVALALRGYRRLLVAAFNGNLPPADAELGREFSLAVDAAAFLGLPDPLAQTRASLLAGVGMAAR